MIQDAWGWCTGTTQRDGTGREEGSGWGTCVHPWWIHVDVWMRFFKGMLPLVRLCIQEFICKCWEPTVCCVLLNSKGGEAKTGEHCSCSLGVYHLITERGYIPTPSDFASAESLKPGVPNPGLTLVRDALWALLTTESNANQLSEKYLGRIQAWILLTPASW